MSDEDQAEQFEAALAAWREKHRIREDDPIFLCVELFHIHQQHWDALRRAEMPPSDEFRTEIVRLGEMAGSFQGRINSLFEELQRREPAARESGISLIAVLIIFLAALAAGICLGKAFS